MKNIEKAIANAKASLAVEGLYVTPEEEALVRSNLMGEISDEEFRKRILELSEKYKKD